jgi:hypothetical protein
VHYEHLTDTKARVEVDRAVQGTRALDGYFTLSLLGKNTVKLPYDTSAYVMGSALESLKTVALPDRTFNVRVSRSGPGVNSGYEWTITFHSHRGNLPLLKANSKILTGDGVSIVVSELVAGAIPLGGTFSLSIWNTSRTTELLFDVSANSIKRALQKLSGVGNVEVTREGPTLVNGYSWLVTFTDMAGNVPLSVGADK